MYVFFYFHVIYSTSGLYIDKTIITKVVPRKIRKPHLLSQYFSVNAFGTVALIRNKWGNHDLYFHTVFLMILKISV